MISLEIKHGSQQEQKILQALRARYLLSQRNMMQLHKKWREADEAVMAYVEETPEDAVRKSEREAGVPKYTTISLPYTYGILIAAHTYWSSAFLSRMPVFQFQPCHGNAPGGSAALEALIDYQVRRGGQKVPYYIWLYDLGKYGCGVIGDYWDEEKVITSEFVDQEILYGGILPTGKTRRVRVESEVMKYQGNKVFNIRPYYWFPDPRKPMHRFQEGEFCGHYAELGWTEIYERREQGEMFNVDVLEQRGMGQLANGNPFAPQYWFTTQDRIPVKPFDVVPAEDPFEADKGGQMKWKSSIGINYMTVSLIPEEWKLGKGTRPEKWIFTCTDDFAVLCGCRPQGAYHGQFPYSYMQLEPEAYVLSQRSVAEIVKPTQDTVDWLVNSHFYNVRAALNNQGIFDPSRIEPRDVYNPKPGGMWRLRPSAYGTDPRTAFAQVPMMDVTQTNVNDMNLMMQMGQRAFGLMDNAQGVVTPGGRKTATEVRQAGDGSMFRQKTIAEFVSEMGWSPLAMRMVQNSQQYMSGEMKLRAVGDLMFGEEFLMVDPQAIAGFFDYVPVNGTLPIDRFAEAQLMRQAMVDIGGMGYDIQALFMYFLQLTGIKNIGKFKLQMMAPGAAPPSGAMPVPGNLSSSNINSGQLPGLGDQV